MHDKVQRYPAEHIPRATIPNETLICFLRAIFYNSALWTCGVTNARLLGQSHVQSRLHVCTARLSPHKKDSLEGSVTRTNSWPRFVASINGLPVVWMALGTLRYCTLRSTKYFHFLISVSFFFLSFLWQTK